MPVERFSVEDEAAGTERASGAEGDAVLNTPKASGLFEWLKVPASAGIVVGVLILAYFLLIGGGDRPNRGLPADGGTLVTLEPQTINLAESGTSLEVRIAFEASSREFSGLLRRHRAQLADIAISVVSVKRIADLDTAVKRNRLKRELADAVGQHLRSNEAHVENVYFTRFYYKAD